MSLYYTHTSTGLLSSDAHGTHGIQSWSEYCKILQTTVIMPIRQTVMLNPLGFDCTDGSKNTVLMGLTIKQENLNLVTITSDQCFFFRIYIIEFIVNVFVLYIYMCISNGKYECVQIIYRSPRNVSPASFWLQLAQTLW